jgi:uncharacterized protein YfdQ (DUF2303 family)
MPEPTAQTEYEAAFQAGVASAAPFTSVPGTDDEGNIYAPILLRPLGYALESLERFMPNPPRRSSDAVMRSVESFTDYVNLFRSPNSRLFADKSGLRVTAVLDYHDPKGLPSWGENRATLTLSLSPEWKTWSGLSGKVLSQLQFAEFLEDNYTEIIEPDGATVLEAASNLEAKKTVSFKSAKRLSDGTSQFEYSENIENKGKGLLTVPHEFKLSLPVYENGEPVLVSARLRYAIRDEHLTFTYLLNQPHRILDTAFAQVLEAVEEATEIKPYLGVVG